MYLILVLVLTFCAIYALVRLIPGPVVDWIVLGVMMAGLFISAYAMLTRGV